jgi:hypothetical protein
MARLSHIVIVHVAHPATQRGSARQFLLATERVVYLNLLCKYVGPHELLRNVVILFQFLKSIGLPSIPDKECTLAGEA